MEPYPTDDGEPDHEEAIRQMGLGNVSPRNPTYISDGAETTAIADVEWNTGEALLVDLNTVVHRETWTVYLSDLWDDWMNGPLVFKKRCYLNVEEDTYNTEHKAAVDRIRLAELADSLAEIVPEDARTAEEQNAIDHAYDALGYEVDE